MLGSNRDKLTKDTRKPAPAAADTYLGEMGVAKPMVELTFGWFGHIIRINPGAGELELTDFLEFAATIDMPEDPNDVDSGEAVATMAAVKDFLRRQIHPDDWALWWDLAKTHRQTLEDLMKVSVALLEKVAAFPTGPLSASPDGQRHTPPKSKADSPSPVTARALELLKGRPDLQTAVLAARQPATGGR